MDIIAEIKIIKEQQKKEAEEAEKIRQEEEKLKAEKFTELTPFFDNLSKAELYAPSCDDCSYRQIEYFMERGKDKLTLAMSSGYGDTYSILVITTTAKHFVATEGVRNDSIGASTSGNRQGFETIEDIEKYILTWMSSFVCTEEEVKAKKGSIYKDSIFKRHANVFKPTNYFRW